VRLETLLNVGTRALDAVSESFSPRSGAQPKEIRVNGAICLGMALLCMLCVIPIVALVPEKIARFLMLLPAMMAYAFLLVGGYRLVFGSNAKAGDAEVLSLTRVVFGIAWIAFLFGTPVALMMWLNPH